MSHVAKVEIQIKNLEMLKAACKALGLSFHEGQTTYKWYGRWMNDYHAQEAAVSQGFDPKQFGKCEHAISAPGAQYEVGVVKHPSGVGFTLLYDNWREGMGLEAVIGKGAVKLKQAYGVQVATQQARRQGFRVQQQTTQDGKVRLVCTR